MIKKTFFATAIAVVLAVSLLSFAAAAAVGGAAMGPVACYPFSRSLSIGVSGSDVTALQNYLQGQGYFSVTPTGYFGALTKAAVGRWQAQSGVVVSGGTGSGTFGPLSRNRFILLCGGIGRGGSGGGTSSSTSAALNFSANPQLGIAPLTVQFVASVPQGTALGNAVDFGDGVKANLGFVPVCSSCHAEGVVSHTYTSTGTFTATLTNGVCSCPANGICNCPNIQILAMAPIIVNATSTATSSIQQLNAPGSATLSAGGVAEIRNENAYFTLQNIASSSATIQVTPVGCWNWFPSDPPKNIVCMIALVPIPPQTLMVGQAYSVGNYSITLTQLASGAATFAVQAL